MDCDAIQTPRLQNTFEIALSKRDVQIHCTVLTDYRKYISFTLVPTAQREESCNVNAADLRSAQLTLDTSGEVLQEAPQLG